MVPVQPNSTRIQFQVVDHRADDHFPGKSKLVIKVLPSAGQLDHRFIKPDIQYTADAFQLPENMHEGNVLVADAEYMGGPRGGNIVLNNIEKLPG